MDLRNKSVQLNIIPKASGYQGWSLGWGWGGHNQEVGTKVNQVEKEDGSLHQWEMQTEK